MMDAFVNAVSPAATLYIEPLPENPPGLTGEDLPLYQAWVKNPPRAHAKTFFNVRVGPTRSDLLGDGSADAALIASLAALRIDCLTFDGTAWWVIEFHYQAGLPQFGRLLAYPHLLRQTYEVDPPLRSMMICTTVNPFLLPLYTASAIPVVTYPQPNGLPRVLNPEAF